MKPVFDVIQLDIAKPTSKTKGGVIIPDSKEKRLEKGKVVGVGEDVKVVKKGNEIIFKQFSADTVELDGKEFSFIKESDVLAIL